jgi:serine/threonine protein kinase
LCDFGFARPHNELIKDPVGTFGYSAPEIDIVIDENNPYLRQFNGVSADIFALGVLLFIMAFGAPFFFQKKPQCYNDYKLFMANKPSDFFEQFF